VAVSTWDEQAESYDEVCASLESELPTATRTLCRVSTENKECVLAITSKANGRGEFIAVDLRSFNSFQLRRLAQIFREKTHTHRYPHSARSSLCRIWLFLVGSVIFGYYFASFSRLNVIN